MPIALIFFLGTILAIAIICSLGVLIIEVIFTIRRSFCNKFAADDEIDIEEASFKNQQD